MNPRLTPETWQRAQALFARALALAPAARDAFLDAECAAEPVVHRKVASLLAADQRAGDLLETPAAERFAALLAGTGAAEADESWSGRAVGPYRIVRELGRGGMGTVYLAERTDGQFEQQVALKIIRHGPPGRDMRRRFLRERQILARLQHKNIARLLDGGLSADGLPYFAMERVDGEAITDYCAKRHLAPELVLRLVADVCAAVHHAHTNLIVHRDLKPSNILVTAAGEVKLLDFGIAKLLDEGDGAGLTHTALPLTLAYAAPEQVRGEPVTTAADVYALGVVLYELLAGERPYGLAGDSGATLSAAILDSPPRRPSSVAVPPAQAATAASEPRAIKRLRRHLRGDLDTIVLMALRKEPSRRYSSAQALADDLRRHLAGLPVRARPDTLGYRTGKFVRRHRVGVAAAALAIAALLGTVAAAVWQAQRATGEAQKAQAVTGFLVSLFEVSDPSTSRGAAITAREILDQGAARIHGELAAAPEASAEMLQTLARVYAALGLYDRARPLAQEVLDLRRRTLSADDPRLADSLDGLGSVLVAQSAFTAAEPLLTDALRMRRRAFGDRDLRVADSLASLAALRHGQGNFKDEVDLQRQALAIARAATGENSVESARRMSELAAGFEDQGDFQAAEKTLQHALAIERAQLGEIHPRIGYTLHALAYARAAQGRYPEAKADFESALKVRQSALGMNHPDVAETLMQLSDVEGFLGHDVAADAASARALAIFRQAFPEGSPEVANALNMLAIGDLGHGRYEEAAAGFREALKRHERTYGADNGVPLVVKGNLGLALTYSGRFEEAEPVLREALAGRLKALGSAHGDVSDTAILIKSLGADLLYQGRGPEALTTLRDALERYRTAQGEGSTMYAFTLGAVAEAEALVGDRKAAESHIRQALVTLAKNEPDGSPRLQSRQVYFATLLLEEHRAAEAEPLLRQSLSYCEKTFGDGEWRTAWSRLLLGDCLRQLGHSAPADSLQRRARTVLAAQPARAKLLTPYAKRVLRSLS